MKKHSLLALLGALILLSRGAFAEEMNDDAVPLDSDGSNSADLNPVAHGFGGGGFHGGGGMGGGFGGGYRPGPVGPIGGGYRPGPVGPIGGGYRPGPVGPIGGGYRPGPVGPIGGGYRPGPVNPGYHGPMPGRPGPAYGYRDSVRFRGGGYPWHHWGHSWARPAFYFRWNILRTVTCTAVDSEGYQYPVIESGYYGFVYQGRIQQIEDAAIDRCYQETGGDEGCRLLTCNAGY